MSEKGWADANAFNTSKGTVIILGVAQEGVSFGLYNMHSSCSFSYTNLPRDIHACLPPCLRPILLYTQNNIIG